MPALLLCLAVGQTTVLAVDEAVPGILGYQGALTDGGVSVTGTVHLKVAVVSADGGTTYWSNDGTSTSGGEPTAAVTANAIRGVFSLLLGDTSLPNMTTGIPPVVFARQDVRLRIWARTGASGPFTRLMPDARVAAVGYALKAQTVSDGAIGSPQLATAAVSASKLAAGAVTTAAVADGAITGAKLAPGVLGTALPDPTGQAGKALLSDGTAARWGIPLPAPGTITAIHLATGSVAASTLAAGAVSTAAVADGAITGAKLAPGVFASALPDQSGKAGKTLVSDGIMARWDAPVPADASITAGHLADGAVTTAGVADGAITGAKLAPGVLASALPDQSGKAGKTLVSDGVAARWDVSLPEDASITTTHLADGAVKTSKLALGAVTTTVLLDGAVTAPKIAAGAVQGSALADGSVGAGKLAPGAVSTSALADGAVGSSKLAPGAVAAALPNQSGHGGQALMTDGAALAWGVPGTPWVTGSGLIVAQANTNYIHTGDHWLAMSLPNSAAVGDTVRLVSTATTGWTILKDNGLTITCPSLRGLVSDWVPVGGNASWRSIASSEDGLQLLAAAEGMPLSLSLDGGATWSERSTGENWRAVAMTGDGARLVAAPYGGPIQLSIDHGQTWNPIGETRNWVAIATSDSGRIMVAAAAITGQLYVTEDWGGTWTLRDTPHTWTGVACSGNGSRMAAVVDGSAIFMSTDQGNTWVPRTDPRSYSSVAMSDDGMRLIASVDGGQLYTSDDGGVNWTARASTARWISVACSSDGLHQLASVYNGPLYHSTDGGLNWSIRATTRGWSPVASSADGTRLVAGVYLGSLYTSHTPSARSNPHANPSNPTDGGALFGSPGACIQLLHTGAGHWVGLGIEGHVWVNP